MTLRCNIMEVELLLIYKQVALVNMYRLKLEKEIQLPFKKNNPNLLS